MQRNQQDQSGWRRGQEDDRNRLRSREDEGRYSSAEDERDYGSYTENDEGDSSVRAGSYDQGRVQRGGQERYGREQGQSGRYSGYGDFGRGEYGGRERDQDRGRADFGGNYGGGRGSDYGYGQRGGQGRQANYSPPDFGRGRRDFGDQDYGGQHRHSSPGGFGLAQGSSAWRGYGVEGDYGTSNERFGEGQSFSSRGDHGGEQYRGGREFGGRDAQYRGEGSHYSQSSGGGLHRGKGPKGYQRSDDRLKEMICERLRDDPHIDASEITVSVQNSRVTFDGTVDSRHTKNLVEDIAEQFGVDDVQNNLRVQRQGLGFGQQGQGRSATGTSGAKPASGPGSDDEQTKQRRSN